MAKHVVEEPANVVAVVTGKGGDLIEVAMQQLLVVCWCTVVIYKSVVVLQYLLVVSSCSNGVLVVYVQVYHVNPYLN